MITTPTRQPIMFKYSKEDYAKVLLEDWRESIASEVSKYELSHLSDLCPDLVPFHGSGHKGKEGASEDSIFAAEQRLGVKLPEDYLAFMRQVSEWPVPAVCPPGSRFLNIDEVGLYRDLYPASFRIWADDEEGMRSCEQIGVYGPEQLPERLCRRHLNNCIAITTQHGSDCYVLNPNVQAAGVWEAWWLGFHIPGAMRFPSFFALLEYEIPRSVEEIGSLLGS